MHERIPENPKPLKGRRGPLPSGSGHPLVIRTPPNLLAFIDAKVAAYGGVHSRAEMIRGLLLGLLQAEGFVSDPAGEDGGRSRSAVFPAQLLDNVPVQAPKARTVKVHVFFSEEHLGKVDSHLEGGKLDRSAFIRAAAKRILEATPSPKLDAFVARLIPPKSTQSRRVKVHVSMPEDELANIDGYLKNKVLERSAFLYAAARMGLAERSA